MYELICLCLFSYWALNFCSVLTLTDDELNDAADREQAVIPAILLFSAILWLATFITKSTSMKLPTRGNEDDEWSSIKLPGPRPVYPEWKILSSEWCEYVRAAESKKVDDKIELSGPLNNPVPSEYMKKVSKGWLDLSRMHSEQRAAKYQPLEADENNVEGEGNQSNLKKRSFFKKSSTTKVLFDQLELLMNMEDNTVDEIMQKY